MGSTLNQEAQDQLDDYVKRRNRTLWMSAASALVLNVSVLGYLYTSVKQHAKATADREVKEYITQESETVRNATKEAYEFLHTTQQEQVTSLAALAATLTLDIAELKQSYTLATDDLKEKQQAISAVEKSLKELELSSREAADAIGDKHKELEAIELSVIELKKRLKAQEVEYQQEKMKLEEVKLRNEKFIADAKQLGGEDVKDIISKAAALIEDLEAADGITELQNARKEIAELRQELLKTNKRSQQALDTVIEVGDNYFKNGDFAVVWGTVTTKTLDHNEPKKTRYWTPVRYPDDIEILNPSITTGIAVEDGKHIDFVENASTSMVRPDGFSIQVADEHYRGEVVVNYVVVGRTK